MKKTRPVLLGLGLLASLFLTACGQGSSQTASQASSNDSSQSTDTSTTNQEKTKQNQLYLPVLQAYKESYENGQVANPEVNSIALTAKNYPDIYRGIFYALEDIDGNGVDELIIAMPFTSGDYTAILAIYTLDGIMPVRLTNASHQMDAIGERMRLDILPDGSFQYYGSGGAMSGGYTWYRWSDDHLSLVETGSVTIDQGVYTDNATQKTMTKDEFDAASYVKEPVSIGQEYTWTTITDLTALTPQTSSSASVQDGSASSLDALASGNYQAIAGRWRNGKGQTFEITSDGALQYNSSSSFMIENVKKEGSVYKGSLRAPGPTGHAAIIVAPAGVEFDQVTNGEATDTSVTRIYAGQGINGADDIYYQAN